MPAATIPNGDAPVNGHKQTLVNTAPPRPLYTTTSYPSNCLQFLKSIEPLKKTQESLQLATVRLNIIIVGAGLGGLAAAVALARRGHKVTVYDQAAALTEVNIHNDIQAAHWNLIVA
jgi:salicylate hydroxylase